MNKKNSKQLTEKELYVLIELLKGKTNDEISRKYFVTLHTVKAHIQNLLYKTNTKHRAELISKIFTTMNNPDFNSIVFQNFLKDFPNIAQ